ncbi:mitochondrial ribosomal small subunit component [Podospora bellae-mahoneyi]|uniref:37S ribosomal protein S25, mitochondrial n=1 Tax=Podospora bellae-mahoneyi TaxID=2093777 RepID=A0ABR0FNN8_9PEZI|nr:mitochondrial ribosomal small subunit component [Podospora bellae-mahoneyi]
MARGPSRLLASRVHQTATESLASTVYPKTYNPSPPWVAALANIPPSEIWTRPYPAQHALLPVRLPKSRKTPPKNLYRPTKIEHPEDRLRKQFYSDHPWELARPKLLMEIDGKDARYRDWSKGLRQPGMKLSGESVVQRQLYLMQHAKMTRAQAYDVARKEFYKLRRFEETEARIAQEEARAYGAYFGKTVNQVGMELEDKEYNNWLKWAGEEITGQEMERQAAYANDIDLPEVEAEEAADV